MSRKQKKAPNSRPTAPAKPTQKSWTRAEIAATIIATLAMLISLWSVWLQRSALADAQRLVLKGEIFDGEYYEKKDTAIVLSAVDPGHFIQSIKVTAPKYGYSDHLTMAPKAGQQYDYSTSLSRAAGVIRASCPKTPPKKYFWICKNSLPIVIEADYITGGERRFRRCLYELNFVDLVTSYEEPYAPADITSMVFVRELRPDEPTEATLESELQKRNFIWH